MKESDVFTTLFSHVDMTEEQLRHEIFDLDLPIRQIAKKYNCSRCYLDRLAKKFNIRPPLPPVIRKLKILLTKERLEEDLRAGLTVKQMAVNYKCGQVVVKKRIKEFGLVWLSDTGGSIQVRNLRIQEASLTQRQRDIIIGSILGDGYISRNKSKVTGQIVGNTSIQMFQCKERKDYLLWKADELKPFTKDAYQDKKYLTYYVNTVNYNLFNEFYNLFIKDGKKIVPVNIVDYLNELVLAVLYMDDGHTEKSMSSICSEGFTEDENYILAEAIEAEIKKCKRKKYGGFNYYLNFPAVEHRKLHRIIDPLFHPCFEYKKVVDKNIPAI